ncbi:Pleckstrin y domain-containing A member 5, partial [Goodea atripinnis]
PSRPSKKIHNFGKRSNSIRRNPSAPVIKRNWLYKQDSTGMKLWKKRWFVLSDLCLFYYREPHIRVLLSSNLCCIFSLS